MEQQEDQDQFKVLEEKVGLLISKLSTLKSEKESLMEKIRNQDKIISDLKTESESLKNSRDKTKIRIQSILDKMGKMDL